MIPDIYQVSATTTEEVLEFFESVQAMYSGTAPGLLSIGSRPWDEAIVVRYNARIVAAVTLAFHDSDRPCPGTLDTLYVLPEHRRKGLGSRLCELSVRRFMQEGWTPVECHVITDEMMRAIDRLSPDLKAHITVRRSSTDDFIDP